MKRWLESLITGPVLDTPYPDAVTNVVACAAAQRVYLSWVCPLWQGLSSVTGYRLTDQNGTVTVVASNTTYACITGLTNGVAMTYTIQAVNAYGWGPPARAAQVTPTGTLFFIKTGGSDALDGLSDANAWASISKVNAATFAPGNVFQFRTGDSFAGEIGVFGGTMTTTQPIVFCTYNGGRATITDTTLNGVNIYDIGGGVVVQDLNFSGSGTSFTSKAGVSIFKDTAGRMDTFWCLNLDCTGFQNGIGIGGSGGGGAQNVIIDACNCHANRDAGIVSFGTLTPPSFDHANITVKSSIGSSNAGNSSNTTSNSGNGIVLGNVTTALIDRCHATANGTANGCTTQGPVGIWAYNATLVVIQRCLAYANSSGAGTVDGGGFDLDQHTSSSTIQYCLAYSNQGPGILLFGAVADSTATGNTVRYNVCYGNCTITSSAGEIRIFGPMANCLVYGNTCVSITTGAVNPNTVNLNTIGNGHKFWNNIFIQRSTAAVVLADSGYTTTAVNFQNNWYWSTGSLSFSWNAVSYATIALWNGATGQEVVPLQSIRGFTGDPLLISNTTVPTVTTADTIQNYTSAQLLQRSQARLAGLSLGNIFGQSPGTLDYYGKKLRDPVFMGAQAA